MKETDRESEPYWHDDGKLPRIVGVDYGINLIDKRIDIVRALEEIIEAIKSTPEVKR